MNTSMMKKYSPLEIFLDVAASDTNGIYQIFRNSQCNDFTLDYRMRRALGLAKFGQWKV